MLSWVQAIVEYLTLVKVSGKSSPVVTFLNFISSQSDPLLLRPYAIIFPSFENAVFDNEIVPSSDKVLGSKNTLPSDSKLSKMYKTFWFCKPEI